MALTPIQGANSFFIGANSTYTNATPGGIWSSGNTAILTINAETGIAVGIAAGNTQVIYTLAGNSTAINVSLTATGQITNGFNASLVLAALQNEILWPSQGVSNSGRYFTDFHPVCDETILKNLAPVGSNYASWLSSLNNAVILECVNSIYNKPQVIDKTQLVFNRADIILVTQPVQNMDQFVGLKLQLAPGDYLIRCTNLMLFFTENVTFTMYLYEDFDLPPVFSFEVTALAYQQVIVPLNNSVMLNYLTPTLNKGGIWYIGYYQSDLGTAQSIYYPITISVFHPVIVWSYSAPVIIDQLGQRNFNREVVGANNLTYGLNLEISTLVDATNNMVENPSMWDDLIGLKMACKIIEMCKFSYQSNSVQRSIMALGGLDELYKQLNGQSANWQDGRPKIIGLIEKVREAAKIVKGGFQKEYKGGVGLMIC